MIENSWKKTPAFIWHIKHWYLITDDYRNQSKVRHSDCLFTNLINFCSHQWSNINVWYVKYKLELLQWIFNDFDLHQNIFQYQTKTLKPKIQKLWLFVYKFSQLLQSPVIKYQCLIHQMKAGVFFNEFAIILINNKTFFINK